MTLFSLHFSTMQAATQLYVPDDMFDLLLGGAEKRVDTYDDVS
jgi:hypothetical protein